MDAENYRKRAAPAFRCTFKRGKGTADFCSQYHIHFPHLVKKNISGIFFSQICALNTPPMQLQENPQLLLDATDYVPLESFRFPSTLEFQSWIWFPFLINVFHYIQAHNSVYGMKDSSPWPSIFHSLQDGVYCDLNGLRPSVSLSLYQTALTLYAF